MAGILYKAAAALGIVDDELYEEELDPEEFEDDELPAAPAGHRGPRLADTQPMATSIVRAEPASLDEASLIADKIKEQVPVALNLEELDDALARRIVDFLSGVTYGLDGSMKKVGRAVFLCAPSHMPIREMQARTAYAALEALGGGGGASGLFS
ncbi:MAG: cell division protein SepF [Armatimonadota bacterium]|jgi:cell division inhibitor SepF